MSVWQEELGEHRERIYRLQDEREEIYQKPDSEKTDDERILRSFWGPRLLEEARKCLEFEAHSRYQIETRLRRWRCIEEWQKAGVSKDATDFYQDARLKLAVRFDEELKQFVPMTKAEFVAEARQSRTRHTNEQAAQHINDWESLKVQGPQLYKRGTSDELINETQRKNAYSVTRRLVTAKEEWGKDKAQLVNYPVFTARQIKDGEPMLAIRLYDSDFDSCVDAWEGTYPPYNTDKKSFYFSTANDAVVAFRDCPPDLYAEHLGQVYIKPDGTEKYAWREVVPNIFCEFYADAQEFVAGLKHGVSAASTDFTRPILATVALELTPNMCRLISTDTYRLLVQEVDIICGDPWQDINERGEEVLLPRDFCTFVAKAMKKPVGEIHVKIGRHTYGNDESVYVVQIIGEVKQKGEVKPVQFVTRCVVGQMVNWRKVLPYGPPDCTILLDPDETTAVLKEMSPAAKNDAERVTCSVKPGNIRFCVHDNKWNMVDECEIPCEVSGSIDNFAFNHKFALDYLSWQKQEVTMELTGALHSFKFSASGSMYVLMPMQVM